jgi:hypothetical protein
VCGCGCGCVGVGVFQSLTVASHIEHILTWIFNLSYDQWHKSFWIVIYDLNDSDLYYKTDYN